MLAINVASLSLHRNAIMFALSLWHNKTTAFWFINCS